MKDKQNALRGMANKRLNNQDIRNNEITFPLTDIEEIVGDGKMTIPPVEDVIHAKEWVDDGSRL